MFTPLFVLDGSGDVAEVVVDDPDFLCFSSAPMTVVNVNENLSQVLSNI